MVGSARRSGPKIQARSGVSAGCKGGFAAKVGPRRPPARSLRLGERGVPTIYFRWALPRRLRVRRPPSFQMVGMARRRRPKIQARMRRLRGVDGFANRFANSNTIPRQGRLRRKYGTPTARRPYHLFSMGAAAPLSRPAKSPQACCLLAGIGGYLSLNSPRSVKHSLHDKSC
jgi:hypothetical protein